MQQQLGVTELCLRVIAVDVNQVQQVVDFLLIAVPNDFVAQVDDVLYATLEVNVVGFQLLVFQVNERVICFLPNFCFQVPDGNKLNENH